MDSEGKQGASTENARSQLATYSGQIQDFLSGMKAVVQQYKFLIEKTDEGLSVDIEFKATISPEVRETTEKRSTLSSP